MDPKFYLIFEIKKQYERLYVTTLMKKVNGEINS